MKKLQTKNTTPFDRKKIPPKQNIFLMPLIWSLSWILTRQPGLKIKKTNMEGLKPPFLVLSTHHSFMDFAVTPIALFPHRANYVSELEGFENYGEWFYRQLGCLGTRKFVNDQYLIRNIRNVIKRKGILVLYPEARYANVGTSSELPKSVGKLAKMLDCPLVTLNMHGNYLQSPIWNPAKRKDARFEAEIKQIYTVAEIRKATVEEINEKLANELSYDEYKWQKEKQLKIKYPKRAEGLHMPLYKCPVCEKEFEMKSNGADIYCDNCKSSWFMDELGQLNYQGQTSIDIEFSHIPDWYEWQRKKVCEEIDSDKYGLDCEVHIEMLPNAVNFIDCGDGRLVHNKEGFYLTFTEYGEDAEKTMFFPSKSMFSVHTEYDYRGKGQCITLSTVDNTYFIFPKENGFNATKIQFATEYLGI